MQIEKGLRYFISFFEDFSQCAYIFLIVDESSATWVLNY